MSTPYNIPSLAVPPGTTVDDATNQAHLILISAVELASDITDQTAADPAVSRTAFALLYLLESAEKLAGFADAALQNRQFEERKRRGEFTGGSPC